MYPTEFFHLSRTSFPESESSMYESVDGSLKLNNVFRANVQPREEFRRRSTIDFSPYFSLVTLKKSIFDIALVERKIAKSTSLVRRASVGGSRATSV